MDKGFRGALCSLAFLWVHSAAAAPATDLHVNISPGVGAGLAAGFYEIAEQFTIPVGQTWRVTGVTTDGFAEPGPVHRVRFFTNSGGFVGSLVCERTNAPALGEFVSSVSLVRNPELRLSTACVLGSGSYFVALSSTGSMQINTSPNLIGNQSLARGGGCTNFVPISSCLVGLAPQELQFRIRGCQGASCEFPLNVLARCSGSNLQLEVRDGDLPLGLTGNGPSVPAPLGAYGLSNFSGPGLWQALSVTEQTGDSQSASLGTLNCGPRSVTLVESGGSTEVDEAQPAVPDTYTVVLDSSPNPGEIVTIGAASDPVLGVTTTPSQIQFDTADWASPKTIEVFPADDDQLESPVHMDTIVHSLSTNGGVFGGVTVPSVSVSIVDNEVPMTTLEVDLNQPAFALLQSLPTGISCPAICSAEFEVGSTVEVTFTGVDGGLFFGWSGDCVGLGACSLTMDGPRRVVATVGGPNTLFVSDFE